MSGATVPAEQLARVWEGPSGLVGWLGTVDHKRIGVRYGITAAAFFVLAGLAAIVMRLQLAGADGDLVGPGTYDKLFTMHGVTMIFLFVTPMLSGFGNYFVPLMLGARDMAFPRLNAFSYWVFLGSGLLIYSSAFLGLAPNAGWFNYVPLAQSEFTPDANIDFYAIGLIFLGISTTAGAINFIVTIMKMRAPGMSLFRMPLFCWAVLATSLAIVFAIPALTGANLLLELERKFDFVVFSPEGGGDPLLWQHLFWIFGHPDVYIIFLPAVGLVSTIVPVFSRRPIVGYHLVAGATMAIALLGFGVWAHHMFATGLPQVTLTFYAAATVMIAIPSGIQIFAWLATIWRGRPALEPPFLYVLGFVVVFVVGGISGVMFAAVPFDQSVTDSYFIVAHFHYVLFGGAVFPIIAALHHWLPKVTGRMIHRGRAIAGFWLVFVGFNLTFFPMHALGLLGMPRRVYGYPGEAGWDGLNLLATIGSLILLAGLAWVLYTLVSSARRGEPAGDDPWGGDSLEWTVSSPPPPYNFARIPRVRSRHPAWDRVAARARPEGGADPGEGEGTAGPGQETEQGAELADGHQAVSTLSIEADEPEVLEMPGPTLWPLTTAFAMLVGFAALIADLYWLAAAALIATLAAIALWNLPEAPGLPPAASGPREEPG